MKTFVRIMLSVLYVAVLVLADEAGIAESQLGTHRKQKRLR